MRRGHLISNGDGGYIKCDPATCTDCARAREAHQAAKRERMKGRGFAALPVEQRREIARRGGLAATSRGTAHRWDSASASAAGKKGGATLAAREGYMSKIARIGGAKTKAKRAACKHGDFHMLPTGQARCGRCGVAAEGDE